MFIHKRNLQVMGRKKKIYVYICIYMMMIINFYHFILLRATSGARNPNLNIGFKRMRGSYIALQ